jgi:Mg-chelatase subunit ChlD
MTRRIQSQAVSGGALGIQSGGYVHPTTSALPGSFPNQTINILPHTVTQIQTVTVKPSLAEAFKPKRAGKKTSHVIFVLDDSGSMQSCRAATISGYNEYLQSQKKDAKETGIPTFVSLYKFDGRSVNCVFNRVAVDEVKELDERSYDPNGMTNLYDAIGGVMMQVNTQLAANKKADRDSVIITILTDGAENSSKTFNNQTIKQMVEKAEGKNWGFMFLGANINAFDAGSSLGFGVNNTMQYDTASMENTMRSASAMTSRMKFAYAKGMKTDATYSASAFTDAERTAAVSKDEQ